MGTFATRTGVNRYFSSRLMFGLGILKPPDVGSQSSDNLFMLLINPGFEFGYRGVERDQYGYIQRPGPSLVLVPLLVAEVARARRLPVSDADTNRQGLDRLSSPRSEIPAVTHVDGSARIQTINKNQHPKYYALLKAFERRTGSGVIINTSFNVRGEPIVESPKDALNCFLNTGMDYLVLGNCLLKKTEMPVERLKGREKYLKAFQLD